jgi:hypothetical protein
MRFNKIKRWLLNIMAKDRWIATKNKILSTLWQCFLASITVFYINDNLSITKDTALSFITAFIGAFLSGAKNIYKEYKASILTTQELELIAETNDMQNALNHQGVK